MSEPACSSVHRSLATGRARHPCFDDTLGFLRAASPDPVTRQLHVTRSTPGLTTALVGHKTPEHVDANLALLTVPPLSPEQFREALAPCRGKA